MRDIGSIRRAQQANPLLVSAMEPGPNWETRANVSCAIRSVLEAPFLIRLFLNHCLAYGCKVKTYPGFTVKEEDLDQSKPIPVGHSVHYICNENKYIAEIPEGTNQSFTLKCLESEVFEEPSTNWTCIDLPKCAIPSDQTKFDYITGPINNTFRIFRDEIKVVCRDNKTWISIEGNTAAETSLSCSWDGTFKPNLEDAVCKKQFCDDPPLPPSDSNLELASRGQAVKLNDTVTYRCLGDARLEQGTNFNIECGHDGNYQNSSWPTCVLTKFCPSADLPPPLTNGYIQLSTQNQPGFRVPAETFNLSTSQPNGISNASTHGPGQAFDGNWATMFKINSSGNIPFLQVDFGQERLPLSIKLVLPNASSGCINNHEDLRVAALNSSLNPGEDPSSRTILEADIQSGIFIFDKPALTRYLVVHAPTGGSSTPLCIAEMDIQFRPKVPYPPVKDCAQLMAYGSQGSSIYNLDITGGLNPENVADVLCRESQWTPILRRFHPQDVNDMFSKNLLSVNLSQPYLKRYRDLFLGLDNIHTLLSTEPYQLRVEMVDRDDKYRRAVYNTFTIESSSSRYRLSVDDFDPSQSVGDPGDAMQFVNGAEFDPGPSPCTELHGAPGWFKPGVLRRTFCSSVNLFCGLRRE
ncbi:uncharacterized protein LOC131887205 [Tigriopus californicus]|uniref:uncharacterized protein LOC131887205 n=1 Tax=Tigriopus californicus TaxID=6832 RepID=UPI0027D9F0F0|nr:uncharacterized protein LOC131887205 [Tigriopus californicus]